jgi:hypothetical protein
MKSAVALLNDAKRVEELHKLATTHAGNAVQYALECGKKLVAIKAELQHGEFGSWCQQLTFGERTVRTYMQAAKAQPQIGGSASGLVTDAQPSIRAYIASCRPKPDIQPDRSSTSGVISETRDLILHRILGQKKAASSAAAKKVNNGNSTRREMV